MSKIRNAAMTLIGINVLMFLIQQAVSGFTENLMLISSDIFVRPWILVTSMFLHANFSHLLFNMYVLLIFGPLIEQRVGTKRFSFIYFLSGIIAGVGYALFQEFIIGQTQAALGASGAVMGILGLTIVLLPDLRVLFLFFIPMSLRTAGIIFALIDLLGVFGVGISGIANTAHLAGLGAGVIYGLYLLWQKKSFTTRFTSRSGSAHTTSNSGVSSAGKKSSVMYPKRKKEVVKNAIWQDENEIHMSKEDIDDYMKNGRL